MTRGLAIVERAHDLLSEGGVCRGHYAESEWGNRVMPGSEHAVSWCAVGAITRAWLDLGGIDIAEWQSAIDLVHESSGASTSLVMWSDTADEDEILATFKTAITNGRIAEMEEMLTAA